MATAISATVLSAADAAAVDPGAAVIGDAYDAGAAAGYVEIRSGAAPAVGGAATGTLLVTITYGGTAFGAVSGGTVSVVGTPSGTAVADLADVDAGTGAWFRGHDSAGTTVEQGDCGGPASGDEMELDSASVTTGDTVTVATHTITYGVS